ncbi:MAG TPA: Gfo/Idh/MocA family oxidoreductase [Bryobacteraceae bacterium]|nr:Gfo/Idh/MocA family oxidoreductase [Bryobacteraceae bacterium]
MNVGIIGLGYMGATHLRAFLHSPGVQVAAICSSDPKKHNGDFSGVRGNFHRNVSPLDLREVAKYTDPGALIDHPGLDAVSICVPTDLHAPIASRALQAGLDVLLEKPMALTAAACDALQEDAAERGLILMIGHVLRFWPEYLTLAEFIHAHGAARIRHATFQRRGPVPRSPWFRQRSSSGGALLDLLIHDIDQALQLFGWPVAVEARDAPGFDAVESVLHYDSGLSVSIEGGWMDETFPFAMSFHANSDEGTLHLSNTGVLTAQSNTGSSLIIENTGADPFQTEVDYFVSCCRDRTQPERCPPSHAAKAVKLALLLSNSRIHYGAMIDCKEEPAPAVA